MSSIVSCGIGYSNIFFGKMSVQILCPYLNWIFVFILRCKSSLYIFSRFFSLSFYFLDDALFFAAKNVFLKIVKSNLSVSLMLLVCFVSRCWRVHSENLISHAVRTVSYRII